jgi:hypothetical protein
VIAGTRELRGHRDWRYDAQINLTLTERSELDQGESITFKFGFEYLKSQSIDVYTVEEIQVSFNFSEWETGLPGFPSCNWTRQETGSGAWPAFHLGMGLMAGGAAVYASGNYERAG